MLTFLELYQTLLGFVFFKLYTDADLVYPPPLDAKKDEGGAGVGAFNLQEVKRAEVPAVKKVKAVEIDGKRVSSKDVRETIKSISANDFNGADVEMQDTDDTAPDDVEEEFVPHPSHENPNEAATLPTLKTLSSLPQSKTSQLFSPYTFWLSRETPRPIFEFLVRSFGGRIGWPATSGSGSPFDEDDESITHVIIDRPVVDKSSETEEERERRRHRKHVQPQWVVDCINAGKILLEEPYAQGKTLPPHLSPFEGRPDAYVPMAGPATEDAEMDAEEEENTGDEEEDEDEDDIVPEKIVLKAAAAAEDAAALRAAELEAEAAGVDFGTFEKEARKARKKVRIQEDEAGVVGEEDMNKMMMSNKQRKLYERMKHGEKKRAVEVNRHSYRLCCHALMYLLIAATQSRAKEKRPREGKETSHKNITVITAVFMAFVTTVTWFRSAGFICHSYPSEFSMTLMAANISPIAIQAKLLAPNMSPSSRVSLNAIQARSIDVWGSVPSSPERSNCTPSTRDVVCSLSRDIRSLRRRGCEHFATMVPMTASSSVSIAPRSYDKVWSAQIVCNCDT